MHSKRGEPSLHDWPDKQILGNVSATLKHFNVSASLQHFYFDQQSAKILQAFQKLELFNFFLLTGVLLMLFFEAPTQLGMMFDDTVRLVCLYMLLLREIFK